VSIIIASIYVIAITDSKVLKKNFFAIKIEINIKISQALIVADQ
jgi:hypothetical protein